MADASSAYYPLFGWRRLTGVTTFTAASAASGYPASNLAILPLAKVWESANVTSQWIKGELDKKRGMRLFNILRHNFSNAAEFRLRIFADGAATQADPIFDSDTATTLVGGTDIWPVVYGNELEWEDDNFVDGKYTDEEKRDTVWCRPIWLDRIYDGLSWRLDFTDPDNPDGFFCIGMVDVSQGFQSTRGIARGSVRLGFEARTKTVTAYGGADYHNRLTKKRTIEFDLPYVPRDEAMGVHYELLRQHDLDEPFTVVLDPNDTKNWLRTAGLFKHASLTPLQRAGRNYENVRANLKEAF